jgi:hypothetical protein
MNEDFIKKAVEDIIKDYSGLSSSAFKDILKCHVNIIYLQGARDQLQQNVDSLNQVQL